MTSTQYLIACDIFRQSSFALRRDDLLQDIRTAHHSPRKVVERALIARAVMVEVLEWKTGLELLDSGCMRLFASTRKKARKGEYGSIIDV